jgi:hypothetical protein
VVTGEAETRRKMNETNRSFIGRWHKLRKKEKNTARTVQKSQVRVEKQKLSKEEKEKHKVSEELADLELEILS